MPFAKSTMFFRFSLDLPTKFRNVAVEQRNKGRKRCREDCCLSACQQRGDDSAFITISTSMIVLGGTYIQLCRVSFRLQVAIICNHQRSVSKSHSAQMSRLGEKMDELKVGFITYLIVSLVILFSELRGLLIVVPCPCPLLCGSMWNWPTCASLRFWSTFLMYWILHMPVILACAAMWREHVFKKFFSNCSACFSLLEEKGCNFVLC